MKEWKASVRSDMPPCSLPLYASVRYARYASISQSALVIWLYLLAYFRCRLISISDQWKWDFWYKHTNQNKTGFIFGLFLLHFSLFLHYFDLFFETYAFLIDLIQTYQSKKTASFLIFFCFILAYFSLFLHYFYSFFRDLYFSYWSDRRKYLIYQIRLDYLYNNLVVFTFIIIF